MSDDKPDTSNWGNERLGEFWINQQPATLNPRKQGFSSVIKNFGFSSVKGQFKVIKNGKHQAGS